MVAVIVPDEQDKNERYLSLAMDIVSQLGPEKAPKVTSARSDAVASQCSGCVL